MPAHDSGSEKISAIKEEFLVRLSLSKCYVNSCYRTSTYVMTSRIKWIFICLKYVASIHKLNAIFHTIPTVYLPLLKLNIYRFEGYKKCSSNSLIKSMMQSKERLISHSINFPDETRK
jgi:hypothetical protein